ncbi:MAG TPA: hypothetical protein VGV61_04600 [Thermoanaerobaculia bacterium]|nr:hypothetical protein [Thermoanaerobaculia bacterium]
MSLASKKVLERLGAFIQELQSVQFQVPEDEAAVARGALFAPRLAAAIEEAMALLQSAHDHYERAGRQGEQVADVASLDDIGRLISTEVAGQEITDLLFLARTELRGALQDLIAAIDQEDFLRVASSCDSGLRTLKRTLISVESALYDFEGLEPPTRQWSDLEVSLKTRRLYAELRREILRAVQPRDDRLPDRLAAVHDRLDRLRELDFYPLLRFDDRVTMRELRRRLSGWVIAEPHDLVAGRRLWQDLVGFGELLKEINHRQELRQHDRMLVRRAYHQLFGRSAHVHQVHEDLLYQLDALHGLDDELDSLLLRREQGELGRWREVLARLLQRLSTTAESLVPGAGWGGE